jgi:hypothetical protein
LSCSAIENELLERLKKVSEGEIYNYPEKQYTKVMSEIGEAEEEQGEWWCDDVLGSISLDLS